MIAITDIYMALLELVNAATTAADIRAPVVSSDLSEPIVRPSIKIILETDSASRDSTHLDSRSVTAFLYYFPPNEHKWRADHFAMMDALRPFLQDSLTVGAFTMYSDEGIEFTETDGVLIGEISYQWYEERPIDNPGEPAETLNLKTKL